MKASLFIIVLVLSSNLFSVELGNASNQQILAELDLAPEQVLMVGDTTYDMAMAEAINIDRIGVSFGVHSPELLEKHRPIAVIDSLPDLLLHV